MLVAPIQYSGFMMYNKILSGKSSGKVEQRFFVLHRLSMAMYKKPTDTAPVVRLAACIHSFDSLIAPD